MTDDPIVEEVHEWRRQILVQFQGDARSYVQALKERSEGKRVSDAKVLKSGGEAENSKVVK